METIRKIRCAFERDKKSIRQIARDFNLARNTVKKILRTGIIDQQYVRTIQPFPKLGPYQDFLAACLIEDRDKPRREQRTAQVLFEQLQRQGFAGGYDSVKRFVRAWRDNESNTPVAAFIPQTFAPGESFQFDWSYEQVELGGELVRVRVAHFRLSYSPMPFCVAYTREGLEMVLDAHARAFEFFGGSCGKGMYDNLKTVVTKVLLGKERIFNRRFLNLASHYLFEPVACTPAAGWEKGQVESQVRFIRNRLFVPRLKFATLEELNHWLADRCLSLAAGHKHPEFKDKTVAECFAEEKKYLVTVTSPFDGYKEVPARVSGTSLVAYDRNRYSVNAKAVGKTAMVRAYATRVIIVHDGNVIGVHRREFNRDRVIYDPWHYLEILKRKPGALRNGAPFKEWNLPHPLTEMRHLLSRKSDGDRQFVSILSIVGVYGLDEVAAACAEAIASGAASRDVVFNILTRTQDEPGVAICELPPHLPILTAPPRADCRRYDALLSGGAYAA